MIQAHLEALRRGGRYSRSTISSAALWLSSFEAFRGDHCPSELRSADLERWQKELKWTPGPSGNLYSESSLNQAVGAVRRFYRWALSEGRIKTDPTQGLVTPKAEPTRGNKLEMSATEARKLLSSPSLETPIGIRDRAILGLLIETGISRPACSRLALAHLQFDTGALLSKGRAQRIHSLGPGLLADIERYLREARPLLVRAGENSPALFLNIHGDRITANSISQLLRYHRKIASV